MLRASIVGVIVTAITAVSPVDCGGLCLPGEHACSVGHRGENVQPAGVGHGRRRARQGLLRHGQCAGGRATALVHSAQQVLQLDRPDHNDFETNRTDHYQVDLLYDDVAHVGLYYMPGWSSPIAADSWCVDWVLLMSPAADKCMVATFHKWIMQYADPPTYPRRFDKMNYLDCVVYPAPKLPKKPSPTQFTRRERGHDD